MSADEKTYLLAKDFIAAASSSSETHLSKHMTSTSESTEMKPSSDVTNSQTVEENQTIDFKKFGLPHETTHGIIEHSPSKKTQKFIRFSFNKEDYNNEQKDDQNNDDNGNEDDGKSYERNNSNNENNGNNGDNSNDDNNNNDNSNDDNNNNDNDNDSNNDNSSGNAGSNFKNGDDGDGEDNEEEGNNDDEDDNDNNNDKKNKDDDVEKANDIDDDKHKENSCYAELGKRLYTFITECWDVDPPEYVLSLVGFSENLPNNTLKNIITSLKTITRIKGSWTIGEAVEYSGNANACGEGNKDNENICIGFVDGDDIDENERMKSDGNSTKHTFEFLSGELNINPNYTHIIIVDGIADIYHLQTAFSCSVKGFSLIIPVQNQNRELDQISDVSDYSEIVKEAGKRDVYLTLLDHDAKGERILTYASRRRWELLGWDDEQKYKDKELESMIKELYKKRHGEKVAEENYNTDVEETYKQTLKVIENCYVRIISTKSDHIFQSEILKVMLNRDEMFQSVCLAMAWDIEDASYFIDTYYEDKYEYEKDEEDDRKNEKRIEELRHDMLLASLLSGKLKHVQHVRKVFGIPKLTKRFLEDLYNASILVHEPCVDWQEYYVAEEGESDGNSCGDTSCGNNDISGGGCTYSTGDVYETCLRSYADYTKFKEIVTDNEKISESVTKAEEKPSKARLRWAKLREVFLRKKKTFPKSIIDDTNPTKALFKWAVLHGLDDIALQLSQTGNNFKDQLEMLLMAVAIISRLRKNAQELKSGEEICVKRLQRYANICHGFMAILYEEGMSTSIDIDDDTVSFALENRDVLGNEFIEDFASSEAVQESIQEKWNGYKEHSPGEGLLQSVHKYFDTPRMKFYVHSFFYFVFLTFLSYLAIMKLPTKPHKSPTGHLDLYSVSTMCVFCAVYSLLYVLSYIGMEIKQFFGIMKRFEGDRWYGVKAYLFDKWNVLDLLCTTFFIAVIPLVSTSYTYELGRVILAVDVSFWILRVLQILKYLEKTGMWIEMLWKMFLDMLKFLIILVIFLFAFGVAMMSMRYPSTDFFESVVKKPYFTIYGDDFLGDLEGVTDSLIRPITIVYLGVYLLVANVLILNVLIAVFNDSYNDVKAKGTKIWKLSRYNLLQEYRTRPILPPPFTIFELVIKVCPQTNDNDSGNEKDNSKDELLTQSSWMDRKNEKTKKDETLNDDTSDKDVAQRCLSLAVEQVPDDLAEVSNYEIKAQLIKKMEEQQKRTDEQKKESNDEFKDQLGKRLDEQLKESNAKFKKLEQELKEANAKLEEQLKEQENKLMNKFDVLLKHFKLEPVPSEQ